jgi:hypothetical protein
MSKSDSDHQMSLIINSLECKRRARFKPSILFGSEPLVDAFLECVQFF